MDTLLEFIVSQMIWVIVAIILIILLCLSFVKVGPNKAVIISGVRKSPRILIGKTGLKIPFIERVDHLPLQQLDVEISSAKYVQTVDFIPTRVDAVGTVRIGQKEDMLTEAAKNFLNKELGEIALELQIALQANIREVIGMIPFKEIVTNPEKFAERLTKKVAAHLKQLGIEVLSMHVQTIEDENRLVKALGAEQTIEIQKTASIKKAEMERDIEVKQIALEKETTEAKKIASIKKAESERDVEVKQVTLAEETEEAKKVAAIKKAEAKRDVEIKQSALLKEAEEAKKAVEILRLENEHELQMKAAALKKVADVERAEAEAAFAETEQSYKQKLEQTEENAKLAAKEREIQLNAHAADSALYVRTKEAEAMKVEADAETYRVEQGTQLMKAQRLTLQEEAEAMLYVRTKEAEAEEKKSDVARYIEEQELQLQKMRGLTEADILKAKKLAEAEGIAAKGDAMAHYGQAAMLEMVVGILPEIAKNISSSGDIHDEAGLKKAMAFIQEATGLNIKDALLNKEQDEVEVSEEIEEEEKS